MNIFFLDTIPTEAAWGTCDHHIGNSALQATQLLCYLVQAKNLANGPDPLLYNWNGKMYPHLEWLLENNSNVAWLNKYARYIFSCYEERLDKEHKSLGILEHVVDQYLQPLLDDFYHNIYDEDGPGIYATCTVPKMVIPDIFKIKSQEESTFEDVVKSYRTWYALEKADAEWFKYKYGRPQWLRDIQDNSPLWQSKINKKKETLTVTHIPIGMNWADAEKRIIADLNNIHFPKQWEL